MSEIQCGRCGGQGVLEVDCGACHGAGREWHYGHDPHVEGREEVCGVCSGSGVETVQCFHCGGSGVVQVGGVDVVGGVLEEGW